MPDEPLKEEQPAPSIWDTFNRNRTTEPRDIAKEVRLEFDKEKTKAPKTIDLEEQKRVLGEAFDGAFKFFRRKGKGDIGVYLISDNRKLVLGGLGGGFNDVDPGEPPDDWNPDEIEVQSDSPLGSREENRRMHTKSYGGELLPQYFRTEKGSLGKITNEYIYDKKTNDWSKEEWLSRNVYEPGHTRNDNLDPTKLQVISDEQLLKMEKVHDTQPKRLPLDGNDYEQLQTILYELEGGDFVRDLTKDVDAE